MNVLFLRPQPAIRSLKYALGFRSVNVEIRLYHGYTSKTLTELYGYGDKYFDKFIKLDLKNLEEDIKEAVFRHHIDIIHSQNAPDFLTVSAIRALELCQSYTTTKTLSPYGKHHIIQTRM